MENEEKYTSLQGLLANAMLSGATSNVVDAETLARWQDRMRSAASRADGNVPDPPAFEQTFSPENLRADIPMRETKTGAYVSASCRLTDARTDMAPGKYIRVPKVVSE